MMAPMEVDGQTAPVGLFAQCTFAIVPSDKLDDGAAQKASLHDIHGMRGYI